MALPLVRILPFHPDEMKSGWVDTHYFDIPYHTITRMHYIAVDPTPGYGADRAIVAEQLLRCRHEFPVSAVGITVAILPRERIHRTNGECHTVTTDANNGQWEIQIIISGKRLPIHPAMQRYVTAHEYGHAVAFEIARQRGIGEAALMKEYAEMRGAEDGPALPGCWHRAVGEVFADDFRVGVMGCEPEFWPHPGFTDPRYAAEVRGWWRDNTGRWFEDGAESSGA